MFNLLPESSHNFPVFNFNSYNKEEIINRMEFILDYIKKIAILAGLSEEKIEDLKVGFNVGLFDMTPRTSGKTVWIPSFFIINFKDLGEDFIVSSLDELNKKINEDSKWLQNLADRLAAILGRKKISINFENRESVRLMVRFLFEHQGHPEKLIEAVHFVLLHELGHLHYEHVIDPSASSPKNQKSWMLLNGLTSAAITFAICFFLSATLYGMLIAIPTCFIVAALATKIVRKVIDSRAKERQADSFAMNALKGSEGRKIREGGVYLFDTVRKHQISLRENSNLPLKERILFKLAFNKTGDNRFLFFTHPSDSDRIKVLNETDLQ